MAWQPHYPTKGAKTTPAPPPRLSTALRHPRWSHWGARGGPAAAPLGCRRRTLGVWRAATVGIARASPASSFTKNAHLRNKP
eukprot:5182401-Pyramimonas_sp.AAC.1